MKPVAAHKKQKENQNYKLRFVRTFQASCEEVFRAWSDPKVMAIWMRNGEHKWIENCKIDLKINGMFNYLLCVKETKYRIKGKFLEIDHPHKLVFTWNAPWLGDNITKVTIILRKIGKKTEMIMDHEGFANSDLRDGNRQGWADLIDNIPNVFRKL